MEYDKYLLREAVCGLTHVLGEDVLPKIFSIETLTDVSRKAVFGFISALRDKGLLARPRVCERKACARDIKDPATKIRFYKN